MMRRFLWLALLLIGAGYLAVVWHKAAGLEPLPMIWRMDQILPAWKSGQVPISANYSICPSG
jgi:hypothetical protein